MSFTSVCAQFSLIPYSVVQQYCVFLLCLYAISLEGFFSHNTDGKVIKKISSSHFKSEKGLRIIIQNKNKKFSDRESCKTDQDK